MDLEIVERRGNAIIVVASFDMIKARPFGLAFYLLTGITTNFRPAIHHTL